MIHRSIKILSVIFLLLLGFLSQAQAQTPQETLNQYISDLQKNPDDNILREKIIKLSQEMKPVPVVPEEAQRFMARGTAAVKIAKNEQDFSDAVAEFEKATLAAPWLANAYYNLGIAQDKAGQYASAIKSLKLYFLAAPNAPDAQKVKELTYEIEYRQEKEAKESSPEALASKKQDEYAVWLKNLDGARFVGPPQPNGAIGYEGITIYDVYYIEGNKVHTGWFDREPADFKTASIRQVPFNDKSLSVDIRGKNFVVPHLSFENRDYTATITDDGQFITFDTGISAVYKRVK